MKWARFVESPQKTTFTPGDWNVLDDLTGMKVKASETTKQWDGYRSTKSQKRHEQDFLRGTTERIRTPWARPESDDSFKNTASALTISSGAITKTQSLHTVDTESSASTDDLDTINGGSTNDFLILSSANSDRDVVLKNATGNIISSSGDFTLSNTAKRAHLRYDGSNWILLGGFQN